MVVKCGGAITERPGPLSTDIARLLARGTRVLLVHGGSTDIDTLCTRLGVKRHRLQGPGGVSGRYTDATALEAVVLALAGAVKPRIVTSLMNAGVPAIGLTGLDLGIVRAIRKRPFRAKIDGVDAIVRDDHSGRISSVSGPVLRTMLNRGMVPVLSPPALAGEEDNEIVNVDADRMAAAVAIAIGADALVMLSGVEGVRAVPNDPTTVLRTCVVPAEGSLPFTGGGMGSKLDAARDALRADVPVQISDGRTNRPLLAALEGAGTRIELSRPAARQATVTVDDAPNALNGNRASKHMKGVGR